MPHFVYVVMLTTCFAGLTVVTNAQCNEGEVQRFVNCSHTQGIGRLKYEYCDVDGLGNIATVSISKSYNVKCSSASGPSQGIYGHNGVSVYVTGGCSALFEVCGEAATTASSETTSVAQTTSFIGLITINYSTQSASAQQNESTLSGLTLTSSTKLFTTHTESQTTPNLPVSESRTTKPITITESLTKTAIPVTESRTPPKITVTESITAPTTTAPEPKTTSFTLVTDSDPITATVIPSSSKTTTEGNRTLISALNAQTVSTKRVSTASPGETLISSSSVQTIISPTSTPTKTISAATTSYGNGFNATNTTGLSTSTTISMSSSTALKPTTEVTRTYSYTFDTTNDINVSALASDFGASSSPLYHTADASSIIPKTLNHDDTGIGTIDISIQHNTAITLSPGVITGIIAAGLLFTLLIVAYVYIVSSRDPCNSVGPSTDV